MKKILVPTDFSDQAEYALKVAAQIARANDSEIILVHMLELPHEASDAVGSGSDIPEIMFFKNKAIQNLEELVDAPYLVGLNVSEAVHFSKASEGITNLARKHGADFIVMGSHGASGYKELFIGSNAEKVVRTADVPVLVIKNEMENFRVENMVFASDFSSEIRKPFAQALALAKGFGARLHLVMINTPNSFKPTHIAEGMMTEFLAGFDLGEHSRHIYNDVNVEKGILNFANSVNADLIGMCTHGRTGFAHFFNGSISEDLVNHAVRPVVTFKI